MYRVGDGGSPNRIVSVLKPLGSVEISQTPKAATCFYDTFDWRLFEAGLSLSVGPGMRDTEVRLRNEKKKTTVAVVPGDLDVGFVADFPDGRLRDAIKGVVEVRRLLPRVRVLAARATLTVRDKEGKAVLRVLHDACRAQRPTGGRTVALGSFLRLAPVRGYAKVAEQAQELLEKRLALTALDRSLQFAAYEALKIVPGDYSSKLRLHLSPAMTAGDAARTVHLTLLETMQRNEAGSADNVDVEFLHDFRVAVRRTRSALAQVDKDVLPSRVVAKAKRDFRWIGQQTNHMRDLDVYLIDYPALQAALPDAYKDYLLPFRDYVEEQSRKEAKRVAAMIRGARYRNIRDAWRAYLTKGFKAHKPSPLSDTPVKELADARIRKAYRKVMKEGAAIDGDSPASDLHELRITCKKLRYLLEFFQSLYPPDDIGELIKAQKAFQNVLGEFQDTAVQSRAIIDFGKEMAAAGAAPVETQMAMGMVAESILTRQTSARAAFHERFDAFSEDAVVALFAKLFGHKG